ncbi:MAG: o-succinylbenzoate synthase, partial [Limosilactobacillus fermentum]
MQIVQATLYRLSLPLKHPFTTSFGQLGAKQCLILELVDELCHHGFGEGAAFEVPF